MYVYIHTCICAHTFRNTHRYIYACMHVCLNVSVFVLICVCVSCICVCVCTYSCICVCTPCVYAPVCPYACVYIYTHSCVRITMWFVSLYIYIHARSTLGQHISSNRGRQCWQQFAMLDRASPDPVGNSGFQTPGDPSQPEPRRGQ